MKERKRERERERIRAREEGPRAQPSPQQPTAFQRHIMSISCIIINITIVHCPICGAQMTSVSF